MSNVLIGIIGVILFIGLALAGALFLGPRFQEATINSKAAATVQAIKQVSDAIGLRDLQEGNRLRADQSIVTELVGRNYLKSIPANPTSGPDLYTSDSTGNGSSDPVMYVNIMMTSPQAKSICAAIVRQTGMTADGTIPDGTVVGPTHPVGCISAGGTTYIAYSRMR